MLTNETNITIVRGKKAWYKLLFPFVCFCIALVILWDGYEVLNTKSDVSTIEVILGWPFAAMLFIILGTVFGMVRDYHFDFKNRRYKIVKRVGIIGFGSWKRFQNLEYVSVFENPETNFEINLWYDSNKHFFIDSCFDSKAAIKRATHLAKQLDIEFHNGMTNQQFVVGDISTAFISKEKTKVDAYFTQGNRPFWHTVIAGACFTLSFVILYMVFLEIELLNQRLRSIVNSIELLVMLMATGVRFSMVNDYLFDLENNQFRIIHNIGPIKWGKWRQLAQLDYISVYQKIEGQFQINLWYNTNKRINISGSNDFANALAIGEKLAKKLEIDLLDASDPHNSKWVEMA
ncbi:hypothetical protein [Rasiella sp. SM2506]|uniref:hypothetical protein n=1 Tax=Rasiella sp. SM2506 TaxID=3423914 RepID=UPI003D7A975D